MKILIIDHNAVDPLSQSLYRTVSEAGDTAVRVIVPRVWFDNYRTVRATPVKSGEGFEVVPVPVVFYTRPHRLLFRGLARQIREFQPDILYVNAEPENFQTLECALMKRKLKGVRFVFSTWRNIDHAGLNYPYRLALLHAAAERFVLRSADHAVAFVPEAASIFSRRGFESITWIPPELDTSVFAPLIAGKRAQEGVFTAGYAGRLHRLKGIDVLLNAIAGLPREFRLVIAGSGPEEAALRRECRSLEIDDRVLWREPVPRGRMPAVLNHMDVLVLPSRTGRYWKEQFGRVLVEAMACGIPVIGSDSGGIPGVIGPAGQIVPEEDVQGLQRALLNVRNDAGMRNRHIRAGLSRVREEYALPVVASRFHRLMKSVLG